VDDAVVGVISAASVARFGFVKLPNICFPEVMITTPSTPIVPLVAPKDISIEEIENELDRIWQGYASDEEGTSAAKASTYSLIVYEPDSTQQLLAARGFYTGPVDGIAGPRTEAAINAAQKAYHLEITGKSNPELLQKLAGDNGGTEKFPYSPDSEGAGVADAIASTNPGRIVTLCPILGEDTGVSVRVSAYCPVQKSSKNTLVCCEYINLVGTANALERVGGMISELLLGDLPKFLWWKATPIPDYSLFKRLVDRCDSVIFDSSSFHEPETDLLTICTLLERKINLADLNWRRLAPWQELTAAAFDPPERRSVVYEIDRVTLDYEKGNPAQALMFVGWLASRLNWTPVAYELEGGDYDLRKIKFTSERQQQIEVELAGIPIAPGDVAGDSIALKLSSTNLQADCCTVLCSQNTGCMRMEASGGAQSCYIQQVAPLQDQKTEDLLSQQLRRYTKEMLYQESMKVTERILKLRA
jgi:glucose-6-phosphate dehydrogenase assembly protein OpcA